MNTGDLILTTLVFGFDCLLHLFQYVLVARTTFSSVQLGLAFLVITATEAIPLGMIWHTRRSKLDERPQGRDLQEILTRVALWWFVLTEGLYYYHHILDGSTRAIQRLVGFLSAIGLIMIAGSLGWLMVSPNPDHKYLHLAGCVTQRLSVALAWCFISFTAKKHKTKKAIRTFMSFMALILCIGLGFCPSFFVYIEFFVLIFIYCAAKALAMRRSNPYHASSTPHAHSGSSTNLRNLKSKSSEKPWAEGFQGNVYALELGDLGDDKELEQKHQ
ncbi:hypothetical protein B0T10DRAFT_582480 [Thelonectria olida]|uniref:Uncharacterized protein n=1 Tax=Thelonectria olida TaxID=1576542 RepID=A0A9P8VXD8_9HYPO|nr:hypothetical protein B0T10DRAFT_582480 [Thelonectria olida]